MANLQTLDINDTANLTIPAGTSGNRPSTTTNIVSFTTVGSTTWTVPSGVTFVEVLVVAGGGGGGRYGGGGGAGGLIYNPKFPVTPGASVSVDVGAGGAGHPGDAQTGGTASNGGNSRFDTLIAIGGGGGGNYNQGGSTTANTGAAGGSGGGSGSNGNDPRRMLVQLPGGLPTYNQGNRGGMQSTGYATGGGGGGGAGGGGENGPPGGPGGKGGVGLEFSISGTATYYAGGGGGIAGVGFNGQRVPGGKGGGGTGISATEATTSIADGTANTGGGGGGSCDSSISGSARAGNGGSGIVIVRYSSTASNTLPVGRTRYNSDTKSLEVYRASNKWTPVETGEGVVPNGLQFYMDPLKYPGSGTTIPDISGQGRDATINGGITYNSTVGYFDLGSTTHTDKYITIPATALNGTTEFTYHLWVYINVRNSIDTFITAGPGNNGLAFFNSTRFINWQNTSSFDGNFPNNVNEWICVTITGRNNIIKFYKNGHLTHTASNNSTITVGSSLGIVLGQEMDAAGGGFEAGQAFLGRYGPVLLYNRELSADEVMRNYGAHRGRFSSPFPMINLQRGAIGMTAETAAPSAKAIKDLTGTTENNFYWIKPGSWPAIYVWCDMNYDGGGWVLCAANARAGSVTGIGGTNGIGALNYFQAINQVHYNGSVFSYGRAGLGSNARAGSQRLKFRCWVGLRHWQPLGLNIAQFCSTDAVTLSQTNLHTKRYRWSYTGFATNYAFQGATGVSDETGTGSPGMLSYHAANGFGFTTYDLDQDASGGNCANNYGNTPWWYGACWSGNMWGGGNSGGYQDGPFWDSSGGDYHNYMAVYLKV